MTEDETLEVSDPDDRRGHVPAPVPPGDRAAWYAEDVRAQYEVAPEVVATVRETNVGFAYDTREPRLKFNSTNATDVLAKNTQFMC